MDLTWVATVVADFNEALMALASVGGALMGVYVAMLGARMILREIGGTTEVDFWDGYTEEDDARDREAAGLSANDQYDADMAEYQANRYGADAVAVDVAGREFGPEDDYADCEMCNGRGYVASGDDSPTCPMCNGSGFAR